MIESEWTPKKSSTRILFYLVCMALIAISVFGLIPDRQYFIGIPLIGLSLIYIYADLKNLRANKKARVIVPFELHHQPDVDKLMMEIDNEFEERVTSANTKSISELLQDKNQKFWVAITEDAVVGTVGIYRLGNKNAALKRLMVAREFRGNKNISKSLLETSINWSRENGMNTIYLGTMSQMKAAHRFYEKNGFTRITELDLPKHFPANPVDTVFYKLEI
jgi:N-acetylglutamate synthase-like GNAT family acetyltransferase